MGSVVVVGGGVAGLTCAYQLRRAGHDVEVLESESQPGGRMRTERHLTRAGEYLVERGAQFLAPGYRNLHGLVRRLGLQSALLPATSAQQAVLRGGKFHVLDGSSRSSALSSFLRTSAISPAGRLRAGGIAIEMVRRRGAVDPYHPEKLALQAPELDDEDMASYLARAVGAEARDYVFAPAISSTFDSEPESLSGAFFLLATRMLGDAAGLMSFDGGLGRFTTALAESVRLRAGCRVTSIESEAGGACVHYEASGRHCTALADGVVVAVPGTRPASLCPGLTPPERSFFERVRYVRGIIVHLLLEERPVLPCYGVAFPRPEHLELYGLSVDHHKPGFAPPGTGLLNVALTEAAASRSWDAPDADVAELALANLAETPLGHLSPCKSVVHRWHDMLPQFYPGYLRSLSAFLQRAERSPRMAFAGDYLVGPYTEGAVTSGMRAAAEIASAIPAPRRTAASPRASLSRSPGSDGRSAAAARPGPSASVRASGAASTAASSAAAASGGSAASPSGSPGDAAPSAPAKGSQPPPNP